MTEREFIRVDVVSPKHIAECWQWLSLLDFSEVLKEIPQFQKVPGFGLASALLDKELAERKARSVVLNMQAIAQAGIDITEVAQVHIESTSDSGLRLRVEMMDIVDLAESGHG